MNPTDDILHGIREHFFDRIKAQESFLARLKSKTNNNCRWEIVHPPGYTPAYYDFRMYFRATAFDVFVIDYVRADRIYKMKEGELNELADKFSYVIVQRLGELLFLKGDN